MDKARQKTNKILKDSEQNLSGDDVREGLTAIIVCRHPDPQFEGQTKTKLGNPEAKPEVENLVYTLLTKLLDRKDVENSSRKLEGNSI